MSSKEQRKMDTFIQYGTVAADFAISDSGWHPTDEQSLERTGVLIGSGIGGLPEIEKASKFVHQGNFRRISPFFIPASLINLVSGQVAIKHGFKGPNHAVVTACSSGTHAIGDAARMIMWEDAEVMIAGGAEAAICELGLQGFAQARALSTGFNDMPERASRPWDNDRDGFVIGEGAGIVVLEEYEHAKKRGARIYAEITGYGMSGDAYHITAPAPDGNGAYRAMDAALKRAKLNPSDIDYVNAHGTSTPLGDVIELNAVKQVFGSSSKNLAMSSTKSSIGHLLGAAGAVEAIFSILSIKHNVVPPTLNLENAPKGHDINLVPHEAQNIIVRRVLSNSFGFGGTNASLIISEVV
jgi:3-oxoacyl-[acyl-carrier-protein] synthase II